MGGGKDWDWSGHFASILAAKGVRMLRFRLRSCAMLTSAFGGVIGLSIAVVVMRPFNVEAITNDSKHCPSLYMSLTECWNACFNARAIWGTF